MQELSTKGSNEGVLEYELDAVSQSMLAAISTSMLAYVGVVWSCSEVVGLADQQAKEWGCAEGQWVRFRTVDPNTGVADTFMDLSFD